MIPEFRFLSEIVRRLSLSFLYGKVEVVKDEFARHPSKLLSYPVAPWAGVLDCFSDDGHLPIS